jgi:hypothetical protein
MAGTLVGGGAGREVRVSRDGVALGTAAQPATAMKPRRRQRVLAVMAAIFDMADMAP